MTRAPRGWTLLVGSLLVVLLGGGTTTAAAMWAVREQRVVDELRFDQAVEDHVEAVAGELRRYEELLHSSRGLFAGSTEVSESEFAAFTDQLGLRERYSSLQALNFKRRVADAGLPALVAARQQGDPLFALRDLAPGPEHWVILFISPGAENRDALGADTAARATSVPADEQARDSGELRRTGLVQLVQDRDGLPGFVLTLPVYRAGAPVATVQQRRAALQGWLTAAARGPDFLASVFADAPARVRLELYDGTRADAATLLGTVHGDAPDGVQDGLTRDVTMNASGRPWTLRVQALPGFTAASGVPAWLLIALGGTGVTGLLAALVYQRTRGERRALQLVEKRTTELQRSNARLIEQNAAVQRYAEVQRDFVASASHELRTPLTSVLGYLELLEDSRLDPEQSGWLRTAARNGQRLLSLVGDLLTANQVDTGNLGLVRREAPVAELLTSLTRTFEPLCAAAQLELTVRDDTSGGVVLVDASRVEQVLANLVSNAVKFSLPGGTVSVIAEQATAGVSIAVSDAGMGISEDELPHVFDRFFRSRSSIKMAVPGTGLGLAIARAIAEEHGGTLTARSARHQGTTFTLDLPSPLPVAPETTEGRPWPVSSSSTTTTTC